MVADNGLRDHPLFICGHPKAGTSLVKSLFDSHPQLIVYPEETLFFRRFLPRARGHDLAEQLELAEKFLIHIFTWNQDAPPASQEGFPDRDYSQIPVESVRQAMQRAAQECHRHPGDLLSAAVQAFGEVSGQKSSQSRYWVEKSPYNEFYAAQIFTWWPMARCLHVIRDPRDNHASYAHKHPEWDTEFFALNWNRSVRAGFQNQASYGSQRYLLLRYEDLVSAPESTINRIVQFLGIQQDDSLQSPTRAGQSWSGNSMFAERFQSISAAPVGRWRTQLEPREAAVIEWICRPWMAKLGYVPEHKPDLDTRWRVIKWSLRWRLQRLSGRTKSV